MRIGIVSDIHGNRFAFDAVLADLKQTSPDLIFHGGDLAHAGANPAYVVDRIRDLGWAGVLGNTDEMLFRPESLTEFASSSPVMKALAPLIEEMAAASREALGEERLNWLSSLPRTQVSAPMALVHATPQSLWRSLMPSAADADLQSVFEPLGQPVAIYAHVHIAFVRRVPGLIVANTGSVSLSHDGDRRASYLIVDNGEPTIRRVEYEVEREIAALQASGMPHADWTARILASARPQMP